jgi:hypothetical protein
MRVAIEDAWSGGAGNITSDATTLAAAQGDLRARRWRYITGCAFDLSRARWTAQRITAAITRNEMECLCRVVRSRSRLAHRSSLLLQNATRRRPGLATPSIVTF